MIPRPLLRPIRATVAILILVGLWFAAGIAMGVAKTRDLPEAERLDIAITLNFAPEAFHITRAQDLGQLVRVEGPNLYLAGVPRAAAVAFARQYWVARIAPWRREG